MVQGHSFHRWQHRLQRFYFFRLWSIFWAEFSVFVFAGIGLFLIGLPHGLLLLVLCMISLAVARGIVCTFFYLVLHNPRPYQMYQLSPIFSPVFSLEQRTFDSFPSGHTTGLVAMSVVVFWFMPVVGVLGIVMAVLTGISRVVMGFHFPEDIVGGVVFGLLIGLLTVFFGVPLLFT